MTIAFFEPKDVFKVFCFCYRSLLPGQSIVIVGGLEQADDARALGARRAALLFEVITHGAGDAVFIHLADVLEEVTVLGALIIPLLEELLETHSMGSEAFGPLETVKSP
ncbi:MAG: hypothetical protein KAH98_00065 [Dehalococcoidia bacterium]|nr:hypothetical protein [Dehalococcoidia bacterium]MCK5653512.1 hypothetical protein [Dehalococcoidia bacterium]